MQRCGLIALAFLLPSPASGLKVPNIRAETILGDPGADSGGEGKSKRAEKYGTKKSKEWREEPFFTFFLPYFSARLDFTSPPLSAPGSPRMSRDETVKNTF